MRNNDDESCQLESEAVMQNQDKEHVINELMKLYSQNVYLLAYSFVKDNELAEDISQEVFFKCYKYIEKFRGEASIKSWLYRITVNTSKNFVRKKSFKVLNFPKMFFEGLKKSESSEEVFLRDQQNDQILHGVLSLASKYREVIILYYFHDLKVDEIGEALNLKTSTVKTRFARGRSILKEILAPKKGESFHGFHG